MSATAAPSAPKAAAAPAAGAGGSKRGERLKEASKEHDVRTANIIAAKGVADAVRTSLGPRGMDKMIQSQDGGVIVTNDGATILSHLQVFHPTAKMLVELSKSQDIEAGDGTTSVVVLCGSLLNACSQLLSKGIHPTVITESFQMAVEKAEDILKSISIPIDLTQRDRLIQAATTSLASKVVSQDSSVLAPIAVDAVLAVTNEDATNVDLRNIKLVKALGGAIEDSELVPGLVFNKRASHVAGAPTRITNAKIGLIQFCLSAPKTDIENTVVVSEYSQMDRILREERKYILDLCKAIQKTGCNVLLVQKSILRDAVNDLSLHFLAKMKILVVKDVERDEVEFVSKTLGCSPVAHIDSFSADKLGSAELVEESHAGGDSKVIKITGVAHPGRTVSVLIRSTSSLILDEVDRSLHDALCVVRALVKKKFMIVGGGAPEMELSLQLSRWSKELTGMRGYCVRAFAEALEVIPYTLAENAGLHPVAIVTELRKQHAEGKATVGINVRHSTISDLTEENVLQPLLVNLSALSLATETVCMILKIDDMVVTR